MLALVQDSTDVDRAISDEQIAREGGFALKAPLFTIGTPVSEIGSANYRASRSAFEEMPLLDGVCESVIRKIHSEKRQDLRVTVADLAMQRTGRVGLRLIGGEGAKISPHAFRQLINRAGMPGGAASYLSACTPDLRAVNMDAWLPRAAEIAALVRTRVGVAGEREVFAVMGQRYRVFDADSLARVLSEAAPASARGEFLSDGSRYAISALFHSDIRPESGVAGEIFRAGVIVESADDGSSSIRIKAVCHRNLCRNLLVIDVAEQQISATHRRCDLEQYTRKMIADAFTKIAGFSEKWTEATRDRILDGVYDSYDPSVVFAQLIKQGLVAIPGVSSEEMTQRLVRAWQREPGWTRSDVINAITRAAHEESWSDPWCASALEERAGQLLYQRVLLS